MRGFRSIGLAVLVVLGACASPSRPQTLSSVAFHEATWGDLMGLSQDDIRVRLGMLPTGETLASLGARLDGGVVVSEIFSSDLIRSHCASAPNGYRAATQFPALLRLTFRDGMLAGVANPSRPKDDVAAQAVGAKCVVGRTRTLTEELSYGQGALMLMVPFMLPFTLPGMIANGQDKQDERKLFASLRLGEPPPGGTEAFVAGHPDELTAASAADGSTELKIHMHNGAGYAEDYKVVVRDGRVAELHTGYDTCFLRADLSLLCGQARIF